MKLRDYYFDLPERLIAQKPKKKRPRMELATSKIKQIYIAKSSTHTKKD